jgi:hypothetical protein
MASEHVTLLSSLLTSKVKLSLCLINYAPSRENIRGSAIIAPQFIVSVLDGDEWSDSRSGRFTPGERSSSTHCIGNLVGLRARLKAVTEREIFCSCRESNTGHPGRSPSLYRLNYPGSSIHKQVDIIINRTDPERD